MIKLRKSEDGYALLLVLFLVVFIMSITAVFMRGAISNAKQEQIVDKNNLVVVAAEMGVEYYETALANEYYIKIKKLKADENDKIALEMKKNDGKDIKYVDIRKRVTKKLRDHLEGYLAELMGVPIIKTYQFSLKTSEFVPEDQDDQNGVIILTATVKGEKDENLDGGKKLLKELNYKQAFFVPSFDPSVTGGGGNGGGNHQLPPPKPDFKLDDYQNDLRLYIPCKGVSPISGEICKTIKVEKIEKTSAVYVEGVLNAKHEVNVNTNSKLYIDGAFNGDHKLEVDKSAVYVGGVLTSKNAVEVNDSKLYITGALNGDQKLDVNNSTVYVGGVLTAANDIAVKTGSNLYVTGALNGMGLAVDESTVYVDGALTVKNHTAVNNNSVLYVTGAFNANKKLDISKSTVYVGGALTAGNGLIVKSNSNVCVAGALSATGGINIDTNSRVYVIGAVTPESISKADNLIIVASLEELNKVCGANANATVDTTPAPTIDVTY